MSVYNFFLCISLLSICIISCSPLAVKNVLVGSDYSTLNLGEECAFYTELHCATGNCTNVLATIVNLNQHNDQKEILLEIGYFEGSDHSHVHGQQTTWSKKGGYYEVQRGNKTRPIKAFVTDRKILPTTSNEITIPLSIKTGSKERPTHIWIKLANIDSATRPSHKPMALWTNCSVRDFDKRRW